MNGRKLNNNKTKDSEIDCDFFLVLLLLREYVEVFAVDNVIGVRFFFR